MRCRPGGAESTRGKAMNKEPNSRSSRTRLVAGEHARSPSYFSTPESFETLVNSVEGIVWEADAQALAFTFVSEQAERLLGYPVQRWMEPGFWQSKVHPDDRDWAITFCYNATQARQDHQFEYRMIAANGRTVWLRDIVTVVTKEGRPHLLRGLMIDITGRKGDEEQRRLEEMSLRRQSKTLLQLATSEALRCGDWESFSRESAETIARALGIERVSIWFFNDDRSVLRCVELYELSLNHHTDGAQLESEMYPRYFAALENGRAVAANDAVNDPNTSEFAQGYLKPIGITSMLDAPIRREGRVAGVVCLEHVGMRRTWSTPEREFAVSVANSISLARETSERLRAELETREAQELLIEQQRKEQQRVEFELTRAREKLVRQARLSAIGEVVASVAHELCNPLGTIGNAVYFLGKQVPESEPKWGEYLDLIEQEVHSANRIITNLLEMSRSKEPARQAVDLERAVREVAEKVPGVHGLALTVKLAVTPFVALADPAQLKQVLTNLFANSMQARPLPKSIEVDARLEDGFSAIRFTDDGPGIPAGDREQVFEPLFTTRAKGTGLGLTISRQIVERHGGTIELGEDQSRGAVFVIRLPEK